MAIFATVLFFGTTFLAVGLILLLAWFALEKMQTKNETEGPQLPEASKLLRDESISTISLWAKLLERFDFVELLKRQIEQAGLNWSIGRVTLSMLLAGTITLVVLIKGDWLPGWMNTALAYVA